MDNFIKLLFITLPFFLIGCHSDFLEDNVSSNEIIFFEKITPNIIDADSSSYSVITIALNPKADTAFSNIKVHTDLGHFSNDNDTLIKINSDRKVQLLYYSGINEGIANIRATVNKISVDTTITLVKALPSYILSSPKILNSKEESVKLAVNLLRDNGRVGKNIKVNISYISIDTSGVLLDVQPFDIIEDRTDSIIISNPNNYKGRFEISVFTKNQLLDTISTNTIIQFE